MKYDPSTLSATDAELAREAEVGYESTVRASYNPFAIVYQLTQTAANAASADTVAGAYSIPTAGLDLQLICANSVTSEGPLVVTLNVTDEDDTSTTAVATFGPPSFAGDQTYNFALGTGVDLVCASGAAKKIKTITGISSVTGGNTGNRFRVVALPAESSWFDIGCTRSKDLTLPVPSTIAIACGKNASEYVKAGRNVVGELSVDAVYRSYGADLARMAGQKVSIEIATRRADRVLVERSVIGGWRCTPQSPKGDGDDEVVTTAEGMFEQFAVFFAI